jgi:fucose 4-O-acetylase-like acetyltransferase
MVSNYYKNGLLDILGALSGSFVCIKFAQVIEKYTKFIKKGLAFIGENSLICLCLHLFALDCLHLNTLHNIMKNMGMEIASIRSIVLSCLWVAITLPIIKLIIKIIKNIKKKMIGVKIWTTIT